ncbi:(Fe-S)-binding protein [Synergistales bacterium]|nr:(Fe-S)-binding protein [Synergistales bacterium]
MMRKIIKINERLCNGCGLCAEACHEAAIGMVDGHAKLLRDDYCDGLGNCLPVCPTGAITFEEREADEYDEEAVKQTQSDLNQWPVQIKLAPVSASYFENANLLVSADCAAYARGDFHNRFMRNKITLIGCPKLDDVDYSEKISSIITENNIKSVTVVRMEVPCCGGIEHAVRTALKNSEKMIPWQVVTLSVKGDIL